MTRKPLSIQARLLAWVFGMLALVWLAVSAALRPLERLRAAVEERQPDDLRPLPLVEAQDELRPLVVSLNHFTERLRQQFERQAQFIADASHELRTPLAALKARIELGLREHEPQQPGSDAQRQHYRVHAPARHGTDFFVDRLCSHRGRVIPRGVAGKRTALRPDQSLPATSASTSSKSSSPPSISSSAIRSIWPWSIGTRSGWGML